VNTIAITGGTGFVGRHLARRHAAAGDRVRILTRRDTAAVPPDFHGSGVEFIRGDLENIPDAFFGEVDVLYHCAAELQDPERMHAVHVGGTRALVGAAKGRVGRWVQLSSVGVYGRRADGEVTEATPPAPVGPYEVTKAEADAIVRESMIPAVILRPSIIFGDDMPNASLRQLVSMIDRGWFVYVGRPGASANYVHIENVVDALMLCARHPRAVGDVFNLSAHLTVERFVATIAEALGKRPPRLRVPAALLRAAVPLARLVPGAPLTHSRIDALTTRATYPSTKITQTLGYHRRVSTEDGLRTFVATFRQR